MTKLHQDTTLGDMQANDRDNFSHINNQDTKTYQFPSAKAAGMFMGQAFDKAMRKLGVKIRPGMDSARIDRLMVSKGVRVEHRVYPPEEEIHVSGFYIYRLSEDSDRATRELAYFVSNPFFREGTIITLRRIFFVRTNVKGVY